MLVSMRDPWFEPMHLALANGSLCMVVVDELEPALDSRGYRAGGATLPIERTRACTDSEEGEDGAALVVARGDVKDRVAEPVAPKLRGR